MPDVPVSDPLPWYIAGPLLGLFVPAMLFLVGKEPGVSSAFRHGCALLLPAKVRVKIPYLAYDPVKEGLWQILFVAGIALGGTLVTVLLPGFRIPLTDPLGATPPGALVLLAGGVLIGFGTRYADGCTSGHTISGLSSLNPASLVASVCFFAGGTAASLIHRFAFGGIVP